jgi:hypothetical protein
MFATIFRTLGLEIGKGRWTALSSAPLGNAGARPHVDLRWNRVRGAGSEPDYIAATVNRARDDNPENLK